jgi:ribosomal protein L7/L12
MNPLNDQQREQIEKSIFAGRKIEAIKLHREATGSQLVDAKRAVEDMEVDLRRRNPENFIASAKKSGCMGVLACAALFIAVAALVSFYILHS